MGMQYRQEETAGYLIYRVGRLLRYHAGQFFREQGESITPEQWTLLLQIRELGNPALGDLVDPVMGDHPNMTRMVTGLERLGYVARHRNPDDRRSRLVSVTPEGEGLVKRLLPELIAAKGEMFRDLDSIDVTRLVQSLQAVLARLEE